jgi:ribonuclease VapC
MVLDSSAVLAIVCMEEDAALFAEAIEAASVRLISAATILELALVMQARFGEAGGDELDRFLVRSRAQIVAFDSEQADLAREAARHYARGRHPVRLNFGDCFSYALSKSSGEPLLFKGRDFALTDVTPAL